MLNFIKKRLILWHLETRLFKSFKLSINFFSSLKLSSCFVLEIHNCNDFLYAVPRDEIYEK